MTSMPRPSKATSPSGGRPSKSKPRAAVAALVSLASMAVAVAIVKVIVQRAPRTAPAAGLTG